MQGLASCHYSPLTSSASNGDYRWVWNNQVKMSGKYKNSCPEFLSHLYRQWEDTVMPRTITPDLTSFTPNREYGSAGEYTMLSSLLGRTTLTNLPFPWGSWKAQMAYLLWLTIATTNCCWNDLTCFCAIPINHSCLNLLQPQQGTNSQRHKSGHPVNTDRPTNRIIHGYGVGLQN
jgi:hypothetical protein